jgi:hypothetical protein
MRSAKTEALNFLACLKFFRKISQAVSFLCYSLLVAAKESKRKKNFNKAGT